jgi:flavorubredoxin
MTAISEPLISAAPSTYQPLPPRVHHAPQRIAEDVHLIRQLEGEGTSPMCVYINSLVITGREPMLVDTGSASNRDQWLQDVNGIVDLREVRWIWISHDDRDHLGNLEAVLELCPNATLVVDWLTVQRTAHEYRLPMTRMRWINDGDHLCTPDRTFIALRPPTYDSPTTRGLYDTRSRVYWSSDSFGTAVAHHVDAASDLPLAAFEEGMSMFNRLLSPWTAMVDRVKFSDRVRAVRTLDARAVATCHGPVIRDAQLEAAFELMTRLPQLGAVPLPGQEQLEAMLAAITKG